ncbi:MAG: hypothetical protein HOV96_01210 [Nonomuraea sp.]|nr:hypothetical protein [Nonomuraea sp.]NUP63082.1 hypothetical protein [Nonomuraea sp.]NUP76151.1 hypothetical protein [Nonomuraea sp.]NUS05931.1 hypothetical protein [Nonomuraea sp.]NUT44185.1 hypothetical protein [Thermoactinospora sp.]
MKRPIISAAIVVALAASGCTNAGYDRGESTPQNEGANADAKGVLHLRNAYLLSGPNPASPAPQQALYAVVVNNSHKPDQLQRVTVDGGGSVQLSGTVNIPPGQAVGAGRPIGTVTGVRGSSVPMTFTFRDAGNVRVSVPVKPKTGQYATLNPSAGR